MHLHGMRSIEHDHCNHCIPSGPLVWRGFNTGSSTCLYVGMVTHLSSYFFSYLPYLSSYLSSYFFCSTKQQYKAAAHPWISVQASVFNQF